MAGKVEGKVKGLPSGGILGHVRGRGDRSAAAAPFGAGNFLSPHENERSPIVGTRVLLAEGDLCRF